MSTLRPFGLLEVMGETSFLAEQLLQLPARAVNLGGVGRRVGGGARLEMIAEVGVRLVADFLGGRLAAVLGDARIVVEAHAAYVQLRVAAGALIEPSQRQAERGERGATFPADQIVRHARREYSQGRAAAGSLAGRRCRR